MVAPTSYQSSLIESLRGAASEEFGNPGLALFANPKASPGAAIPRPRARGPQAFNPPVLTMPTITPVLSSPPGDDMAPPPPVRDVDPLPVVDDIDVPLPDEVVPDLPDLPDAPVEPPPIEDDPIEPLPEDVVLPEVPTVPDALPGDPGLPDLPPPDDRPDGLTPIPDTVVVDVKPPKKDASGWGEGGDDLVRDDAPVVPSLPDPVPSVPEALPDLPVEDIPVLPEDIVLPEVLPIPEAPAVAPEPVVPEAPSTDDRPDALVPIPDTIIVEEKAPKKDASGWGEGGESLVRDDEVIVPSLPDPVPSLPEPLPDLPVEDIPLLPEEVDLPEVPLVPDALPETEAPVLPDAPVVPEELPAIDDTIDLLPEDVDLPEVLPVDEIVLPDVPSVPDELPFIDYPIELLPEEVELPSIDPIPESPFRAENAAALTDLYQEVFDRQPDEEGFDFWLMAMNDLGYTPDMVRDAFLSSPEYQDIVARREAGSSGLLTESGG